MEALDNGRAPAADPRALAQQHLVICVLLFAANVALGLLGGSKALALLAAYALLDAVSATVLLLSSSTAVRATSRRHPYGLGKAEFVATLGMSLAVMLAIGGLAAAGVHNLLDHRQRPPDELALWGAAATLVACWIMGRRSHRLVVSTSSSAAVEAHADLLQAHVVAAILVLLALVLGRAGFLTADLAVAAVEAVHVVWCASRTLRRAVKGLLDLSADPRVVHDLRARIHQVHPAPREPRVRALQYGQALFVSATVEVDGALRLAEAEQLRRRITRTLRRESNKVEEIIVNFTPPRSGARC